MQAQFGDALDLAASFGKLGVAVILDPMLATGGSAVAALATLREWGVKQVKLLSIIASSDGIAEVELQFAEVGKI